MSNQLLMRRRANSLQKDKYIRFADPVVESICIANWSTDGKGVTYEDALAVTNIGTIFSGNTEIISFDELRFFGINTVKKSAFDGCSSLVSISFPNGLKSIEILAFRNCSSLKTLTFGFLDIDTSIVVYSTSTFDNTNIQTINIKTIDDWYKICNVSLFNKYNVNNAIYVDGNILRDVTINRNDFIFRNVACLENVFIKSNVTIIPDSAFTGTNCNISFENESTITKIETSSLQYVDFGNAALSFTNLNSLGNYTLYGAKFNKIISLGNITAIGIQCFRGSTYQEITIPDTITVIGSMAFAYNNSTIKILATTPPVIANDTFYRFLGKVYVPYSADHSVLNAYKTAQYWSSLESLIYELDENGNIPS